MSTPKNLTNSEAQEVIENVLAAFRARDIPTILNGFTEDALMYFGPMPEIRGRDGIGQFLTARFKRQNNYRLAKELRMVEEDRMAVAWEGWWDDAITGKSMYGKGVEVWTISGGKIARWEAAFNSVPEDEDPAKALGIV